MKDTQIVILHGWTASQETESRWQPFVKSLRSLGFTVTFLLLPGLTQPLSTSWNLDQYADWTATQVDTKKPCLVIGHSFGGQIAIRMAARYEDSIAQLVLIDSSGIPDDRWWKRTKRFVFLIIAKIGKLLPYATRFKKLLYSILRERDYYQATELQKETMRQVIREDLRQDAKKIKIPTLVLWGEKDTITPPFMGFTFNSLIPKSQIHIIDGARHSPQYTHPAEVVEAISNWLSELEKQKKDQLL